MTPDQMVHELWAAQKQFFSFSDFDLNIYFFFLAGLKI